MKVIGIDPGLATTGIGIIDVPTPQTFKLCEYLTLTTAPPLTLPERLLEMHRDLSAVLALHRPEFAVVEKLFFATNEKTALDVAHARGVILLTLAEHGIPILEPTPLQMKSCITGDGSADKRQVSDMVVRMLNLKEPPKPDDAADALALALYGALQHSRMKLLA